jgi:hypothetical protein
MHTRAGRVRRKRGMQGQSRFGHTTASMQRWSATVSRREDVARWGTGAAQPDTLAEI